MRVLKARAEGAPSLLETLPRLFLARGGRESPLDGIRIVLSPVETGVEGIKNPAPFLSIHEDPPASQNSQMMGDDGGVEPETGGEAANAHFPLEEEVEDLETARVREGL